MAILKNETRENMTVTVSDLLVYPIKSSHGVQVQKAEIGHLGLQYDRHWAIFDQKGRAITARTHPVLLDVQSVIEKEGITLVHDGHVVGTLPWPSQTESSEHLHVHSYQAYGCQVDEHLDQWFSDLLGMSCRVLAVNNKQKRPVMAKHGGQDGDQVGFNDQAPILLISEASLDDLNKRMTESMDMNRFRPNIVINGCPAYDEDQWEVIQIGEVQLRIIQQCERCVFTTIDPLSKEKHSAGEPLTTLAKYRIGPRGGLVFGVHAVPLEHGTIHTGNQVRVLSTIDRPVSIKA